MSSVAETRLKDAHVAMEEQQARGARVLLWLSLLAVASLIVWACFAWIDEVVRGEGKVVPSRQVQVVQSLDGGIVEELLVSVGQTVEAGQVLLRIDPTRYTSSLGENRAEYLS
ncbi:MAG TPA: biotin/lipoyl-binding protein, partial [Burkholderiaceae bacterium]|nr:biotin/lipoyl-binding protein [Burkholderiaceae bacterium]